ncbi:MAG: hypothetical protein IJE45_04650 [Bacilli bacterium]|nr:hypothetical protein [Bacilli bacterium]
MQKAVGIISITEEGNISFSFQDFYIEIFGSRELKEIKSVKEYDKETGFIVLDTNYGEEFYCLEDTIEGLGLSNEIVVKDKLKNCDKWLIS